MLLLKLPSQLETQCLMPDDVLLHRLVSPVYSLAAIFGFHSHSILFTHTCVQVIGQFVDFFLEKVSDVTNCFEDLSVKITFLFHKVFQVFEVS